MNIQVKRTSENSRIPRLPNISNSEDLCKVGDKKVRKI